MSHIVRSPAATAAAVLSTAAIAATGLAGPASAATPEYYDVQVDATVDTSYTGSAHTPALEHDASLSTSTHVTSGFLASIERAADGRILGATGQADHEATTTGTVTTREREFAPAANDWYERATSCVGAGKNKNDVGRTSLISDPLTPLVGGALRLNVADQLLVAVTCQDTGRHGGAGPRSFVIESAATEDGDVDGKLGPLGVDFALPPEATAAGKVIQLFEGPAAGQAASCPTALDEQPHRTACRVTFRGTITMTKVDPFGVGGGTGTTPTTPTRPTDPVRPGTTTPARAGTGTAPVRPSVPKGRARLQAGGRSVAVRVACPGACTGTATFRVPARGTKAGRKLAAVRVRVPKGAGTRTVRIPVPRAARAALRRTPGATVVLALRGASGPATTATLRIAR